MQVFDASSMIHAWDNYPIAQFPKLWEWIAGEVGSADFTMPRCALEEVAHKTPECGDWLHDQGLTVLTPENDILQRALQIKHQLGIVNDAYHVDGVDENDIVIIASACVYTGELVSNERKQPTLPQNLARWKIPAVCQMQGVAISCVSFVELVKQSARVF